MADFDGMIAGLRDHKDTVEAYFLDFFSKKNRKEYHVDQKADSDSLKAIRIMFESKKELRERVEQSFSYDPFCLEAFFVYYVISEDIYVDQRFRSYYEELNGFADLDPYRQEEYLRILDFYVEFLLDVHNMTRAARVERQIIRLTKDFSPRQVDRLSFIYASLEEKDDFYRLFLDSDLSLYSFLLLIVTLLKHDDRRKAQEVCEEMLEKIEYASYLDHMWDLDLNDGKQKEFYQTVEDCYEFIGSVPDFFTFINLVREKRDGTI